MNIPKYSWILFMLLNILHIRAQVLIGPACTTACIPVSLMAKEYNVPVISYACSGTSNMKDLLNKNLWTALSSWDDKCDFITGQLFDFKWKLKWLEIRIWLQFSNVTAEFSVLSDKDVYPNFARSSESLSGASTLLMKVFGLVEELAINNSLYFRFWL